MLAPPNPMAMSGGALTLPAALTDSLPLKMAAHQLRRLENPTFGPTMLRP